MVQAEFQKLIEFDTLVIFNMKTDKDEIHANFLGQEVGIPITSPLYSVLTSIRKTCVANSITFKNKLAKHLEELIKFPVRSYVSIPVIGSCNENISKISILVNKLSKDDERELKFSKIDEFLSIILGSISSMLETYDELNC